MIPLSQTAPNIDFDEFLAGLDTETRAYLQLLLAGLGEGLNHNGRALSATFKRFAPTARLTEEIARELKYRHAEHRALDPQLPPADRGARRQGQAALELVDASNTVFAMFAKEEANFKSTLELLPGALHKTRRGHQRTRQGQPACVGPTLQKLLPFARALGAGERSDAQAL